PADRYLSGHHLPGAVAVQSSVLGFEAYGRGHCCRGYGGASAFLKKARFDATFQHALDLILFFIAAVGAAIGVACGVVAVHVAAGLIHPTEIVEAFFYNTVADVIGSVVIVPPLLAVRALRNSASHVV